MDNVIFSKKYISISLISLSVSMYAHYLCRAYPNYFLMILILRFFISSILVFNIANNINRSIFLLILISSYLGIFLGHYDELTWLIPLYESSFIFYLSGVSITIGGVYVFIKKFK